MMDEDFSGARRRRGVLGLLLVVLLAFVGGGFATVYAVRHWDRVAAIVRPPVAAPAPVKLATPPPAPLIAPVTDPGLIDRINALDERVEAIDNQAREASGNADRAEGLLVAFAARRIVDRGQPLGYLETMLRNHFGGVDPQAVAMVIAAAQRPATLPALQQSFADLAPRLVATPPKQSWWTGFRQEMGALFVIRRAETPSTLPDDRRDRARSALQQGQVDVALAEIVRLPGAAGAKDWIASARRYVLVHNALDRIETAALLAPPEMPPAAPQLATASSEQP
ncbi:hypothetical protein Q4F19_01965 [Sphingomonas sp. BIUV-7]|uniref:Inner membrane protein n=1 Tax=Sphingomonas natans TaxID=3063330 RepID=A0ABT8Y495_9SPHN|nr:hypothetical protein [Sphingomonas sp. BIUV-7]MDO6413137.1 hypothetical protein [Sphingomonas sp. BIUV-7]